MEQKNRDISCDTPPPAATEEYFQVTDILKGPNNVMAVQITPVDLVDHVHDANQVTPDRNDKNHILPPPIPSFSSWALTPPSSRDNSPEPKSDYSANTPVSASKGDKKCKDVNFTNWLSSACDAGPQTFPDKASKSQKESTSVSQHGLTDIAPMKGDDSILSNDSTKDKTWKENFANWLASSNNVHAHLAMQNSPIIHGNRTSCSFDDAQWIPPSSPSEVARCSTPEEYLSSQQPNPAKCSTWDPLNMHLGMKHVSPVPYLNPYQQPSTMYNSPPIYPHVWPSCEKTREKTLQDSGYSSDMNLSTSMNSPYEEKDQSLKQFNLTLSRTDAGSVVSVPKLNVQSLRGTPMSIMLQQSHELPGSNLSSFGAPYQMEGDVSYCAGMRKRKAADGDYGSVYKRPRHNEPLPSHAVQVMTQWYDSNVDNPYPTKSEKEEMAGKGGISMLQVKSWFANKRNRSNNTKPKMLKKQREEKLLNLCHEIARNTTKPENLGSAYIIQQLSAIISEAECPKES